MPCLAGFLPAVYLTEDILQTDEAELSLRHELTHLRHLDYIRFFCRAAAVSVYWWNPRPDRRVTRSIYFFAKICYN